MITVHLHSESLFRLCLDGLNWGQGLLERSKVNPPPPPSQHNDCSYNPPIRPPPLPWWEPVSDKETVQWDGIHGDPQNYVHSVTAHTHAYTDMAIHKSFCNPAGHHKLKIHNSVCYKWALGTKWGRCCNWIINNSTGPSCRGVKTNRQCDLPHFHPVRGRDIASSQLALCCQTPVSPS